MEARLEPTTIEQLQTEMGLFVEDNPIGIIFASVEYTEMYDLLKPYLITADNELYFNYGNRFLLHKYNKAFHEKNYTYIKKAVLYALVTESYKLNTLIQTTNFDYNPIENYKISETIVTSTTISANFTKGLQVDTVDTTEIITTDKGTNTNQYGEQNETGSNNTTFSSQVNTTIQANEYGKQDNSTTNTNQYGAQSETGNTTLTKSPYNNANYQPYEKTDTSNTRQEYTDTLTTVDNIGEHSDTLTTTDNVGEHTENLSISKKSETHTDTQTKDITKTQNPYTVTTQIGDRQDKEDKNDKGDTKRNTHGVYGLTSVQDLIKAEREVSDLSIVNEIIQIVLNTITNGIMYME